MTALPFSFVFWDAVHPGAVLRLYPAALSLMVAGRKLVHTYLNVRRCVQFEAEPPFWAGWFLKAPLQLCELYHARNDCAAIKCPFWLGCTLSSALS